MQFRLRFRRCAVLREQGVRICFRCCNNKPRAGCVFAVFAWAHAVRGAARLFAWARGAFTARCCKGGRLCARLLLFRRVCVKSRACAVTLRFFARPAVQYNSGAGITLNCAAKRFLLRQEFRPSRRLRESLLICRCLPQSRYTKMPHYL